MTQPSLSTIAPAWKLDTVAVHGGYSADPTTRAVAVPIYQTVAFAFDDTQHGADPVSYTHLTLPTKEDECRSRWSPYH